MRELKHLVLLVCFAVAGTSVLAQEALVTRLAGVWHEYSPADNIVEFSRDGSWRLYLKKGEIGDLRTLGGQWRAEGDGRLIMILLKDGQQKRISALVSFEGEEMILTDGAGNKTRHRRHKGSIPDVYRW